MTLFIHIIVLKKLVYISQDESETVFS